MQRLGVLIEQHRVCRMEQPLISDARAFYGTDVAKEEYMKLIATFRVNAGLRHNVPAASAIVYSIGDSDYTYSEMPCVWTGTHRVVGFDGKAILVDVGTMLTSLKVSHLKSSPIPLRIMRTEVLTPSDPRVGSPEMTIAMKDEIDQLFARGTFKIVILRDRRHKSIRPTKFIWTINLENGREVYKARFVIRGHRDRCKDQLVLTATSLSQTSVRLLFAMASIFDWPIWTADVRQAYLQSASFLLQAVFLNPNRISGISIGKEEFLQLTLSLYGLSE
jgi:Reverse transcriptase (RNA-dependent DNA polymerase)